MATYIRQQTGSNEVVAHKHARSSPGWHTNFMAWNVAGSLLLMHMFVALLLPAGGGYGGGYQQQGGGGYGGGGYGGGY
jgi:hypothetical protein